MKYLYSLLLIIGILSLQACSTQPRIIAEIEQRVSQERSIQSSCQVAETQCAIPSGLLNQALLPGSRASIIHIGEQALILRLHMIRAAKEKIDLQYFIFGGDNSGRLIMHELLLAARRGVKVRVLFDQLFSDQDIQYLSTMALAHTNLDIRLYNPTFNRASTSSTEFVTGVACCFFRFNQRMHNKVFQIDNQLALIGGRNLADRYFDMDTAYNFKDRDILLAGPVVVEIVNSFDRYWRSRVVKPIYQLHDISDYLLENKKLHLPAVLIPPRFQSLLSKASDANYIKQTFSRNFLPVKHIEYFWDLPRKETENKSDRTRATDTIFQKLRQAKSEIIVQSPYMVISSHLQKIYRQLKQEHPQIRLLYSTNSLASTDAWTAYALYHKKKKRYIQKLGIEIHELMPFPGNINDFIPRYETLIAEKSAGIRSASFMSAGESPTADSAGPRTGMHSKSLLIDKRIIMVGSHNMDPRSEGYNTENGVFIDDPRLAAELAAEFKTDMSGSNSWVVAARSDLTPVVSDISGVFEDISATLPVFDIWPFSYTTGWQRIPDGRDLSPTDPEFHRNYIDVGRFPEVIMTKRQILTLTVGSFFGFLRPIM